MSDTATPAQPKPDASASTDKHVNVAGIRTGYVLGGIAWLACFVVASRMGGEAWLNVLICLVGSIIGWWAGILISPDPTEAGRFSDFRKAVSAFISGFLLAKFDVLFQGALSRDVVGSPLFIGRILLFATTSLICAQFTYVARHDLKGRPYSAEDTAVLLQRLLRMMGIGLTLIGIVSLVYVASRRVLDVQQSLIVAAVAAAALTIFASSDRVREWVLGRQDRES